MTEERGPGVWTIAFGVVLGLTMFTAISAVVGTLVFQYSMREASTVLEKTTRDIKQLAPVPKGHWTNIEHPVRGRDECLAASAGVADEKFARCRNGWTERVWVQE